MHKRQKKTHTATLLQGTSLPDTVTVARNPLPEPLLRPTEIIQHGHQEMEFVEPPNREGEAPLRARKRPTSHTTASQPDTLQTTPFQPPPSQPHPSQYFPFYPSPFYPLPQQPAQWYTPPMHLWPATSSSEETDNNVTMSRQANWRRMKAAQEDQERSLRGEPPRKRYTKRKEGYSCSCCKKPKTKENGHTQVRGNWYCPEMGLTIEDWRSSL